MILQGNRPSQVNSVVKSNSCSDLFMSIKNEGYSSVILQVTLRESNSKYFSVISFHPIKFH